MKKIAIILLAIAFSSSNVCFAQTDCDKCFKKEKKSMQETMFANEEILQTKFQHVFQEGVRGIYFQFKRQDGKDILVVRQQTDKAFNFKQALVLGQAIKIGLKFDTGNYVLTFSGNQTQEVDNSNYDISSNETDLNIELSEMLSKGKLLGVDILNPTSSKNQTTNISTMVKSKNAEKLKNTYACFMAKK